MNSQANESVNQSQYHRFQVYLAETLGEESKKSKIIGMAYLRDGQPVYTVKLWTLTNEKFYVIPSKHDSEKFLVMTREPNKTGFGKGKYFWNIVGNGRSRTELGAIELDFDLLAKPIYMSLFPEKSAHSAGLPNPEEITLEIAA